MCLAGFSSRAPPVLHDRLRFQAHPNLTAQGLVSWDASSTAHGSLEPSWLPQQPLGNFFYFWGHLPVGDPSRTVLTRFSNLNAETSWVHTRSTSQSLTTPVTWHREHSTGCFTVTSHTLVLFGPPPSHGCTHRCCQIVAGTRVWPVPVGNPLRSRAGNWGFSRLKQMELRLCLFLLSFSFPGSVPWLRSLAPSPSPFSPTKAGAGTPAC